MFWALFSFWVLIFTIDMILLHRNIQILFSVTAATTKLTCYAVSSFLVLRLYTFIWSFIKGTFEFFCISLLSSHYMLWGWIDHKSMSVTAGATKFTCCVVLHSVSEFWDYTLPHDPSPKGYSNSTFFYCFNHKVNMLFAVFSFWVLRFTFHMILHQRNIQLLFSVTFAATKFTFCAV